MSTMEQIELNAYRQEIVSDMQKLVEKYRTVFNWDIPEVDERAAKKLIVSAMQTALNDIAENSKA
ncbi:MAG: hypothetical protein WA632_15665 [Gallionella sp.]